MTLQVTTSSMVQEESFEMIVNRHLRVELRERPHEGAQSSPHAVRTARQHTAARRPVQLLLKHYGINSCFVEDTLVMYMWFKTYYGNQSLA